MRYLIAGNGPAGVRCAEAVRARDKTGSITMLSPDERPYSRITVPEYLTGEVAEEDIYYRTEAFYEEYGVERIVGRLAGLNPLERSGRVR